ncbi:MAG: nucleoside 2-deoxyribosyltransferase [Thalassolituus sp.]
MKIYLAGPEVFLPDANAIGERKKALCAEYGFKGLFPLDTQIAEQSSARDTGLVISAANEDLIREADMVIANLTPFRGASADVGTVYELGLARGMGKKIHGYSNDPTPYTLRVLEHSGAASADQAAGELRDTDGYKIEEFELHDNLMIDGGILHSGGQFLFAQKKAAIESTAAFEVVLIRLSR